MNFAIPGISVIVEYSGILLKTCYAESGLYLRMNDVSDYYVPTCMETQSKCCPAQRQCICAWNTFISSTHVRNSVPSMYNRLR